MIESIMLVTIMLAIGLFLVFRYLVSFIDKYLSTIENILNMHQLSMEGIEALAKEINYRFHTFKN
jgi:hypothetical protein